MDVLEAIFTRRSVRKYLIKAVEWDKIGYVVRAGQMAPSSGNLQNYKFILVTMPELRKEIATACLQQMWMVDAPVHIVICGQEQKAVPFYGVRGERLYTIQNTAASAMNMILMANAQGLGSCWVGAFDEDMLKSSLGITDGRPHIVLTIGYADPSEIIEMPVRYRIENITYLNKWKRRWLDLDRIIWSWNIIGKAMKKSKAIAGKLGAKAREMSESITKKLEEEEAKEREKRGGQN